MGDPVEAGTALDRIHRLRMDWQSVALAVVFAVLGIFIQYLFFYKEGVSGYSFPKFLGNTIGGLGLMAGLCFFGNYTFIGKRPFFTWSVYMLLVLLLGETEQVSVTSLVLPMVFAGIVYHYRNKRYQGIAAVFLWLTGTAILLLRAVPWGLTQGALLFTAGMALISFAVYKGWYGIPKRMAALLWIGYVLLVIGGAVYLLLWGAGYQSARIRVWLRPGEDADYLMTKIREILAQISLVGGKADIEELPLRLESSSFFLWLVNRFGSIAGILLAAALCMLFLRMFCKLAKQTNQLGTLIGIGSLLVLLVPTLLHILSKLALVPYTEQKLPFFSVPILP